jgi:hypothetical protein
MASTLKTLFKSTWAQVVKRIRQAWKSLLAKGSTLIARLKAWFLSLWESARTLWTNITDGIAHAFETAFKRVRRAWDKVFGWISKGWDKLQASFDWISQKLNHSHSVDIAHAINLASASAHPAAHKHNTVTHTTTHQANRTQQNTVHQDIKIHIASSDPVAAGRATVDALRQQRIATHNSHSAAKL